MWANSYLGDALWTHGDERRIYLTLGISILLHILLLLAWKLPPQIWNTADQAVLTVVLRAAAPRLTSSPTPARQPHEAGMLVQTQPAPAVLPRPPTPAAQRPITPAALPMAPTVADGPLSLAIDSASGRLANPVAAPVGVTVTLVIGVDGRVRQIYWDKLPALTDGQLRRVETAIRDKTYASGQVINEIFDVRAFLKLPPARTEEGMSAAVGE